MPYTVRMQRAHYEDHVSNPLPTLLHVASWVTDELEAAGVTQEDAEDFALALVRMPCDHSTAAHVPTGRMFSVSTSKEN